MDCREEDIFKKEAMSALIMFMYTKQHLVFREYLKKYSIEAEKYGTLKKELAKKHPMDIESYIQGKEQLVKEIEKRAMEDF